MALLHIGVHGPLIMSLYYFALYVFVNMTAFMGPEWSVVLHVVLSNTSQSPHAGSTVVVAFIEAWGWGLMVTTWFSIRLLHWIQHTLVLYLFKYGTIVYTPS